MSFILCYQLLEQAGSSTRPLHLTGIPELKGVCWEQLKRHTLLFNSLKMRDLEPRCHHQLLSLLYFCSACAPTICAQLRSWRLKPGTCFLCLLVMPALGSCAGAGMGVAHRAAGAVVPAVGERCFALNSLLAAMLWNGGFGTIPFVASSCD